MDNCTNCAQANLVIKLEKRVKELEDAIGTVKIDISINAERTTQVFEMLKEIKDSIKEIAAKINTIEAKPGKQWDEVIKTIILVCVTAFMTWMLKK